MERGQKIPADWTTETRTFGNMLYEGKYSTDGRLRRWRMTINGVVGQYHIATHRTKTLLPSVTREKGFWAEQQAQDEYAAAQKALDVATAKMRSLNLLSQSLPHTVEK